MLEAVQCVGGREQKLDELFKGSSLEVLVTQLCLTLCNPMDCSPPGSSVHGISQARTLEWVVIFFSRASSDPGIGTRSPALQVDSATREALCNTGTQPTHSHQARWQKHGWGEAGGGFVTLEVYTVGMHHLKKMNTNCQYKVREEIFMRKKSHSELQHVKSW